MKNVLQTLMEVSIYSSAMIIAFFALKKLFSGRISAKITHILWLAVLLRLLVPVTFESPVNVPYPAFLERAPEAAEYTPTPESEPYDITFTAVDTIENIPLTLPDTAGAEAEAKEHAPRAPIKPDIKTVIMVIWLAGAGVFLLSRAYKMFVFSLKIRRMRPAGADYAAKLAHAKKLLGIKQNVRISESRYADIPLAFGVLRPVILMPEGFTKSMDDKKISYIIIHELCHVKRRDLAFGYLWLFAGAVHWFNPLVHIAYQSYLDTVEEACDEMVLGYLGSRDKFEYSQSLLDVMRLAKGVRRPLLSVSLLRGGTTIRKRVMKMMHPKKKSKPFAFATILAAFIMCFACFTTACTGNGGADTTNESGNAAAIDAGAEAPGQTAQPGETPAPTPVKQIGLNNKAASQPIKRNPVGSKEEAVAIAKSINISNAESFTYQDSFTRGLMEVHMVSADGDTLENYQIYDLNGEICNMQTAALLTKELGPELSEAELCQKVVDFAMRIYPGTTLDITDCSKIDRTWEVDGVEYESKDYQVTGKLTDSVDGSVRTFSGQVRLDGCVKSVSAEYNGMDYLELPNEVRQKVLSYAESNDAEIDLFQISDYYGNRILHFTLGKQKGSVTLLESDMSLVDYLNIPNQTDAEYSLNDSLIDELIQKYADQYFPGNTDVTIDDSEIFENDYVGEGTLTDSRGEMYFYIQLNGDGKVHKIGIKPNVDKESLPRTDKETALRTAIDTLLDDCKFTDESRLEVLSQEECKNEYIEAYKFEFKYTSLEPTILDYSYNAFVDVNVHTGKPCSWRIDYIEDGLDVISREEAIEKARGYVAESFGLDPDELVFKEFIVMTGRILEFQANFTHENGKSYGASMLADTGELDGIGSGGN